MFLPSLRPVLVLVAVVAVALAGCGKSSANGPSTSPTSSTTGPVPTVHIPPTAVVTGGSVAATVNGQSVPMSTYRTLLTVLQRQSAGQPGSTNKALGQRAMQELIADTIISQYAAAHNITISNAEIDTQMKKDEQQSGGSKAFQQRLGQFGLTTATYKILVRPNLLAQKVEQKVAPASNKPVAVAHVRHILISTKPRGKAARTDAAAHALAQQILTQIQHGGNFATLAKKYSDDTGSAAQGGKLPTVYPGQTVPQFNHAAFTQKLNTPAIVKTMFGYHIVEVLSRGTAPMPAQGQQQQQQQKFNTWLQQQIKAAKVKQLAKVAS